MKEQKVIITIMGLDRIGIIAAITGILAGHNCNIQDISQTILQDYFTMIMLVDLEKCDLDFAALKQQLKETGESIGMQVNVQHTDIFDYMHRI